VIKQRTVGWTGRVASVGKKGSAPSALIGKHEARNHTEGVGVHGKLILNLSS